MRFPAYLGLILVILLHLALACPRANSQTSSAKNAPDATVSGKVTIKGKPAPGIVVGMRASQPSQFDQTYKATTGQDGKYRINNVPGGNYEVAPITPSFIVADAGGARGQTVVITEGENVEDINFELVRGGVITGKVVDAEGHPLVEEGVSLQAADRRNQSGPPTALLMGFRTDDRGVYRIFGIRPGRYKVSVGQGGDNFYGRFNLVTAPVPLTFSPDTTDPAKAAIIEITEGTEATKIDITVGEAAQSFTASGRAVDENGKPVPNLDLGISRSVQTESGTSTYGGSVGARSNNQGEFQIKNLAPGKYSVTAYSSGESNIQAQSANFEIVDQDVSGVVVKTSTGTIVSGVVVFEGTRDEKIATALANSYVAIYVRAGENHDVVSGRAARLQTDGGFTVGGLSAGTATFGVESGGSKGFSVTRIERDGVVQPNGIEIQKGEQINGVRVFVVRYSGSIRGVVKPENGSLPAGARISVQLSKEGDPNIGMRSYSADSRGHFLIEGLAPGNYELNVVVYAPEWRGRPLRSKRPVTIMGNEPVDITIGVDLTPQP
jgi:protocatechuate 3,4-dioxygenase beta subunit